MVKYVIHALGLKMAANLIIQPMCPIDEYAIIVRNWVWFIPITPPTTAFMAAIDIIKFIFFWGRRKAKMDSGANFCHVDRIKQEIHEIEAITEGYQKWQGTLPSFNIIAAVRIRGMKLCNREKGIHKEVLDIKSKADPKAWARKYFTDPSVSWLLLVCIMIGINLRRLSSIAPHTNSQLALDKAIRVLSTKVTSIRAIVGDLE